jgi:hypothetical protein
MEYSWTWENLVDTTNITSDVRFSHTEADELQAFVIEFTKARLFADPFEDILDTYLNFQYWFFENGVIEVHFGDIHMDGSPVYAPGKGLYCYSTSEGVDTTEVCGPHMGIGHPLDEENAIGLEGAYNDYEIYPNQYGFLTVLPPEGWVIRFKPTSEATSDPNPVHETLHISPNPTSDYLQLPYTDGRIVVVDGTGRIVYDGYLVDTHLDVSFLPAGLFYLQIITPEKFSTGKFIRQ